MQAESICGRMSENGRKIIRSRSRNLFLRKKSLLPDCEVTRRPIFAVIKGSIGIQHILYDGRRTIAAYFVTGELIDLRLRHFDRHEHLLALTNSHICMFNPSSFDKALSANSSAQTLMTELMRGQLHRSLDHSVDLGKKQALEKTASFICECHKRQTRHDNDGAVLTLPMLQYDIAEYLGLQPETVSRCLRKLEDSDVVRLPKPTKIIIKNMSKLEHLANGARL